MATTRKLPFQCVIFDTEPQLVQNRFGGDSIMLEPDEIAVYDTLTGAEMISDWVTVRKGIDWFIEHNTEAYAVLLDLTLPTVPASAVRRSWASLAGQVAAFQHGSKGLLP